MAALTAWDFVSIAAVLLISASIGIYYAIKSRRNRTENTEEFMSGGHRMPIIPTALSLMASFMSGIGMLSVPAEIYTGGVVYAWTGVGAAVSILFCTVFVVPVLYRVKSVSMYAYVQDRFESKWLRLYSSTVFQLSSLMYMAVVLYAPAVALTALSGLPTWIWILSVGVVCTVYTSVGGLKAVVWTDTFQAIIMYAGLLALVIKGTMAVGGLESVFERAREGGRLSNAFNMDPDPFQYMTFWTALVGSGMFTWIGVFGTSQVAMQRYKSLPSLRRAQIVGFLNIPAMLVIMGLIYYLGMTMFAYYAYCDPLKAGYVQSRDQLVIRYTLDVLGGIYGLPGLYLASIFSATLSTISSGINSLSAAALEDYVRLCIRPNMDERTAMRFNRMIGFVYGILSMALAFAAEPLGGILLALNTVAGSLNGPNVGLILAGILCPWANKIGGTVGVVVATALNIWIFTGSQIIKVPPTLLPTSINGCAAGDFTSIYFTPPPLGAVSGLSKLYRLSFVMYSCMGTLVSFILCLLISAITGGSNVARRQPDMLFWCRDGDSEKAKAQSEGTDEKVHVKNVKVHPVDMPVLAYGENDSVYTLSGQVTRF